MTKIIYELTEEKYILGNNTRTSYGITAYANSDIDGSNTIIEAIQGICDDKEKLSELVTFCNRLKLSVLHLRDVVEDFLFS